MLRNEIEKRGWGALHDRTHSRRRRTSPTLRLSFYKNSPSVRDGTMTSCSPTTASRSGDAEGRMTVSISLLATSICPEDDGLVFAAAVAEGKKRWLRYNRIGLRRHVQYPDRR